MGQEKYQLLAKAYEPDDQTLFVSLNTFSVLLPAVLIKLQLHWHAFCFCPRTFGLAAPHPGTPCKVFTWLSASSFFQVDFSREYVSYSCPTMPILPVLAF
jgi:hypothetical protein